MVYYNENDRKAAAWLRELIAQGHIANGVVDERSIADVRAGDLDGFDQCHFFAGIGVWSYALRLAGWPDDRPIWTASCPCQPFSAAGKRKGTADERHLWPELHRLIAIGRPVIAIGEQVASKDGLAWFDLVRSDLEGADYACGASDTCAAGYGAPHIRQRLYWMAVANRERRDRECILHRQERGEVLEASGSGESHRLAEPASVGRIRWRAGEACDQSRSLERSERFCLAGGLEFTAGDGRFERGAESERRCAEPRCGALRLGDGIGAGLERRQGERGDDGSELATVERTGGAACGVVNPGLPDTQRRGEPRVMEPSAGKESRETQQRERSGDAIGHAVQVIERPGPTNGFWRNPDWLLCTDGKWRPVRSGSSPLAHGSPARVGRLRGYGNAIVAAQAAAFIECVSEIITGKD